MANRNHCQHESCGKFVKANTRFCKEHQKQRMLLSVPKTDTPQRSNALTLIERYSLGEARRKGAHAGHIMAYAHKMGWPRKKANAARKFMRELMSAESEGINEKWGSFALDVFARNTQAIQSLVSGILATNARA